MRQSARGARDRAAPRLRSGGGGATRRSRRSSTPSALGVLRERIGELEPWPLAARARRSSSCPRRSRCRAALIEAVGAETVFTGDEDRLRHASGQRLRRPGADARAASSRTRPTRCWCPPTPTPLRRVLDVCARRGRRRRPLRRRHQRRRRGRAAARRRTSALISLDLAALREVEVDQPLADRPPRRRPARARGRGGARPRRASPSATSRSPSSTRRSAASPRPARPARPRAATGASTRWSARSACWPRPATCETLETPHTAAGPALRELVVGSEGVLGVIPDVTVRVRPAPPQRRYEAWIAESFEAGGGDRPRRSPRGPGCRTIIRVSDEEETEGSLALSGPRGLAGKAFDGYLGLRRRRGGALMIVGFEGDEEARRPPPRPRPCAALRAGGAAYLGQAAGRSWEHGRYQGPYLRDTLMGMGAMVETLETSHTWSRLGELHAAVGARDPRLARRAGHAGAGLLPPLARLRGRRLALLHLHLPRPPRRRAGAVGGGQARRLRGDRRRRRHDHPPPRGRPRPRALHGGRGGGDGPRGAARGQGAARPGRDHEPGEAAARPLGLFLGFEGGADDRRR